MLLCRSTGLAMPHFISFHLHRTVAFDFSVSSGGLHLWLKTTQGHFLCCQPRLPGFMSATWGGVCCGQEPGVPGAG